MRVAALAQGTSHVRLRRKSTSRGTVSSTSLRAVSSSRTRAFPPVFTLLAVVLTLRLSRTPDRGRVWIAAALAALFLVAASHYGR